MNSQEQKIESSFEKLSTHLNPVNYMAVRVAFFKGESFIPKAPDDYKVFARDFPGRQPDRPPGCKDFTGLRCGKLTALFFLKFKNPGKPRSKAIWVCRCDCGKYELRIPCKWIRENNQNKFDECSVCRLKTLALKGELNPFALGKNKQNHDQTRPARLMRWVDHMRSIGLSDNEICDIRKFNVNFEKGSDSETIRLAISVAKQMVGNNAG